MNDAAPESSASPSSLPELNLNLPTGAIQSAAPAGTPEERLLRLETTVEALATPENVAALQTIFDGLTKSGTKTTEFWLYLIGLVGILALAAEQIVPGNTAAWCSLIGVICYGFYRSRIKGAAIVVANKISDSKQLYAVTAK